MSTLRCTNLQDTSGGNSLTTAQIYNGAAKAWVNFNGTFATSPFTTANGGIRAAFNVSSVTDNGVGNYTVNFTTAMMDASYSGLVSIMRFSTGSFSDIAQLEANGMSASSVGVRVSTTSANFDSVVICVAIFR